jgi:molybdate transport system substrate-binding protein
MSGAAGSLTRRGALFGGLSAGLGVVALGACSQAVPPPVTVFAAASLTDALEQIARAHTARTGQAIRLSFGASGALARQIEAGAPADIIILAEPSWMDRLEKQGRIDAASRSDLLGNRLVLIAAADARIDGDPFAGLGAGPGRAGGRLAIGDPESVPAGAYARRWLQATGQWDAVQSRLVMAADVRAVRTFVARGEAALGVVYRSDAVGADNVRVVLEPPASEQPRIVYPAALIVPGANRTGANRGAAFLRHLRSPEAMETFRRYGFDAPHV